MPDLAFYKKLKNICSELQMKPEDLLLIMTMESGISGTARNSGTNASGLIQFMPNTLKNMGWTQGHDKFREMDATNQLDYVKSYVQNLMKANGGPFQSAARCYVAVLYPVALGLPGVRNENMSTPIMSASGEVPKYKGISPGSVAKAYDQNKGLDADKDGVITYGDLNRKMDGLRRHPKFLEAMESMKAVGANPGPATDPILSSDKAPPDPKPESSPMSFLSNIFDGLKQMWTTFSSNDFGTYIVKISGETENEVLEYARLIQNSVEEELKCKADINHLGTEAEIMVNCEYSRDYEEFVKQINAYFSEEFNSKYGTDVSYKLSKFASSSLPPVNSYKLENAYLAFRKK